MSKKLSPDFKPSQQTYNNLCKHGAIPEFVDFELEMFIAYFTDPSLPDSKAKKTSWEMTCQRWMRTAWQGKSGRDWEYKRHQRSKYETKNANPFDNALDQLEMPKNPIKPVLVKKSDVPVNKIDVMPKSEVMEWLASRGGK